MLRTQPSVECSQECGVHTGLFSNSLSCDCCCGRYDVRVDHCCSIVIAPDQELVLCFFESDAIGTFFFYSTCAPCQFAFRFLIPYSRISIKLLANSCTERCSYTATWSFLNTLRVLLSSCVWLGVAPNATPKVVPKNYNCDNFGTYGLGQFKRGGNISAPTHFFPTCVHFLV